MNESARHYGSGLPRGLAAGTGLSSVFADSAENALTRLTHRAGERRRLALLAHALETDVIPRLVLARHESAPADDILHAGPAGPTTEDMASLAHIVLRGDLAGAMAYVQDLRARNIPLERIYLSLLAPVARHLGELWAADRSDFASVTIGLCCLQQLVLENSAGFGPRAGRRSDVGRRVLLAPVPGEQHSFGLLIVGEFFRRQGWDVFSATGASARELVAMARKERFSVMGFSLACESRLDILATLIRDVRRATRNPHLGILVGGAAFAERPELAALVGADATATDGQQAVLKAETLLALLARED
jgi:methanogenic corrinoid protein MtbC1